MVTGATARAASGLAVHPDGRVWAAWFADDDVPRVARLSAAGVIEVSTQSSTIASEKNPNTPTNFAVRTDTGEMFLVGWDGAGTPDTWFTVLRRISPGGADAGASRLDPDVGKAAPNQVGPLTYVLEPGPNGTLLVGGSRVLRDVSNGSLNNDALIFRLVDGGAVDPTFGNGGGVFRLDLAGNDVVRAMASIDGGPVVAGGRVTENGALLGQPFLARTTANGLSEPTFGSAGSMIYPGFGNSVNAVAVLPDGRVVAATQGNEAQSGFELTSLF